MTGSTLATVIIVVAAVAGLTAMLGLVLVAARRPYFTHPHIEPMPGKVKGGVHIGDPRSQGPPEGERADLPAEPGPEVPAATAEPGSRRPRAA